MAKKKLTYYHYTPGIWQINTLKNLPMASFNPPLTVAEYDIEKFNKPCMVRELRTLRIGKLKYFFLNSICRMSNTDIINYQLSSSSK